MASEPFIFGPKGLHALRVLFRRHKTSRYTLRARQAAVNGRFEQCRILCDMETAKRTA